MLPPPLAAKCRRLRRKHKPSPIPYRRPGAMGASVRRGRALLAATRDSLPHFVGNSLRCFSCHLDEGRRASGLPLTAAYIHFPQYRARRARVDLIEDRVNDCFVRSMNGRALPVSGDDMRDIVAYIAWLSRGLTVGDSTKAKGVPSLATLDADTSRGAQVFVANCVRCHGASGEGSRGRATALGSEVVQHWRRNGSLPYRRAVRVAQHAVRSAQLAHAPAGARRRALRRHATPSRFRRKRERLADWRAAPGCAISYESPVEAEHRYRAHPRA